MRLGIVRTDLGHGVYLADIDSAVQYSYSDAVRGQSRTLKRPTDAALLALIRANKPAVAQTGSNTAANVATNTGNVLRVRTGPGAAFSSITVTSGAATAKGTVRDDLNAGFAAAGLALVASIVGTNQIRIQTLRVGSPAYLEIDVNGSSTLNAVIGLTAGAYVGSASTALLDLLKAAVYPTATTFNVAAATIVAVGTATSTFALLADGGVAFAAAVADAVAPLFVNGGDLLLSLASGHVSKLMSSAYKFKGVTGVAAYATADDGSTAYTYP